MKQPVFFILNTKLNRAELLNPRHFPCWELVQSAFAFGFCMSDGYTANGIGRSKSIEDFIRKANHGGTTILMPEENDYRLTIEVNGHQAEVASDVWRSWSGRRFVNGIQTDGERFYWLTDEVYHGAVAQPCCGRSLHDCDCDPLDAPRIKGC